MVRAFRLAAVVIVGACVASACTMKKSEMPPLTGPSELALSLSLAANPDIVNQDGSSQSQVIVQARDQGGQPIKGLPLRVDLTANRVLSSFGELSSRTPSTDADGRATVIYTAPQPAPGNVDQGTIVTVIVTPIGTNYSNSVARTVEIRLVPTGSGPVAFFTYLPLNPTVGAPVTFDGTGSQSNTTISTYSWNFGDGGTATSSKPVHAFARSGAYTVTLSVTDASGKTGSTSRSLYVQ